MNQLNRESYADDEMHDILRRAVAIEAANTQTGRLMLEQTAAELGISPEALALAEKEHQREYAKQKEMQEFVSHRRRDFWEHFAIYVAVNTFLIILNLVRWDGHFWALYPLLGWGIFGVAMDAYSAFAKGADFDKEFRKWKRNKDRKGDRDDDDDDDD